MVGRTRRSTRRALLLAIMMVAALVPAAANAQSSGAADLTSTDTPALAVFAPDTDPEYAQDVLDQLFGSEQRHRFASHWDPALTALDNGGGGQGDSLELTWSIIPDGTSMPSQFAGDTTCASDLIATFDANYGAGVWQAEIQAVWDDWTSTTGNVYTPAVPLDGDGTPIDDGAAWPSSLGLAGVRGDIRIGGCTIDGDFGILAFNFFPSNGDMKIDAPDSFYTGALSPDFHNVFSHEHGHGAGLAHVCPIDMTKLMEPIINTGFVGLQHDDIRGVHRGYGDRFERINNPNDSQSAATALLPLGGQFEPTLSIDGTSDEDWFAFYARVGDTLDVSVAPDGFTYDEGDDPASDLCASATPTPFDSEIVHDLGFEIRDASGLLLNVDSFFAPGVESVAGFSGFLADGVHYIKVYSFAGADDVQLYDLDVTLTSPLTQDFDYGDAPDPRYPTLRANGGPLHLLAGIGLGGFIDFEPDGQPDATATGDDLVAFDDEDGVTFGPLGAGTLSTIVVEATPHLLDGWIDFNADGDWYDPGEQILTSVQMVNGFNTLQVPVPAGAALGTTFARFRLSSAGGLPPTGMAADGEVEDYLVTIVSPPLCNGLPATHIGTEGDDSLSGTSGDDVMVGLGGGDLIEGGDGNDAICGGDGDDQLFGGQGDDYLDGGAGVDSAGYDLAPSGVTVDLGAGTASGGDGVDTLVKIRNLIGSPHDDKLAGNALDNFIDGLGGNDKIKGKKGDDTIFGGDGDDILQGRRGDDFLDGGAGVDLVSYLPSTTGVDVDLAAGTATGDGSDTLSNIENVKGSQKDDILRGNAGPNELFGFKGVDVIEGRAGDDDLRGKGGDDELVGGNGDDRLLGGGGFDKATGGPGTDFCKAEIKMGCELPA